MLLMCGECVMQDISNVMTAFIIQHLNLKSANVASY